ncbi:MAG TPA: protein phosphatase 2C domain-containing protein [Ktedonobacteraceae bacterium]|nr:protein phosphatase 2C domain-containing protein [Ktedonobacteraceae bacterium]
MPQNQDEQPYPGQQYGPGAPQRSSGDSERGRQHPPKPAGPYAPQPPPGRSAGTYPPQQTPGAPGPYPPQPPVGARFSAPGGSDPQQPSPALVTPPRPQRPPDQLFLGAPPRVEPPPEARQVVRHARARSTASALFNVSPGAEEPIGTIDYALVATVVFLLIAVIVVLLVLFGKSIQPPGTLTRLLIGAILYAGCVFGGYLWGRYQADTETRRENMALRQNIDLLQDQLDKSRHEVRSLRAAAGSQQPYTQGASRDYQPGRGPAIVAPRQIEQQQPVERIYDKMRDPEGYSEQDKVEFPHEKAIPPGGGALELASGWKVIGASRRGYAHSYQGSYREDDFNIVSQQGMALVAIADGVSSKSSSRFGARAAVLGATVSADQQLFLMLAQALNRHRRQPDYENIARTILFNSLQSAYASVEQQARARNLAVDDLQSTLLVFLAAPLAAGGLLVASVQVGDGAIFALEPDHGSAPRDQWSFLQQPQIQAAGNEVQPFMTSSRDMWEQVMQVKLLDNPAAVMGMTDGTADDIEPPPRTAQNPDADPFFLVNDFYKHIQADALSNGLPGAGLLKFLSYKKKGSADDRTVVCLYR